MQIPPEFCRSTPQWSRQLTAIHKPETMKPIFGAFPSKHHSWWGREGVAEVALICKENKFRTPFCWKTFPHTAQVPAPPLPYEIVLGWNANDISDVAAAAGGSRSSAVLSRDPSAFPYIFTWTDSRDHLLQPNHQNHSFLMFPSGQFRESWNLIFLASAANDEPCHYSTHRPAYERQ